MTPQGEGGFHGLVSVVTLFLFDDGHVRSEVCLFLPGRPCGMNVHSTWLAIHLGGGRGVRCGRWSRQLLHYEHYPPPCVTFAVITAGGES